MKASAEAKNTWPVTTQVRRPVAASSCACTASMRDTLNAKNTPLSNTPTATPAARLWVAMVMTTVASITALDRRGWRTTAPSDFQSKVEADTITMMATSAITGTRDTQSFSATMRISKNTPANSVDSRPRPPYFTLLTA